MFHLQALTVGVSAIFSGEFAILFKTSWRSFRENEKSRESPISAFFMIGVMPQISHLTKIKKLFIMLNTANTYNREWEESDSIYAPTQPPCTRRDGPTAESSSVWSPGFCPQPRRDFPPVASTEQFCRGRSLRACRLLWKQPHRNLRKRGEREGNGGEDLGVRAGR